MLLKTATF
nr:unnamed protein product [Callosobruchus analis]